MIYISLWSSSWKQLSHAKKMVASNCPEVGRMMGQPSVRGTITYSLSQHICFNEIPFLYAL